jgi:hypothetical protein
VRDDELGQPCGLLQIPLDVEVVAEIRLAKR